jgi:hypothetical protein
VLDKAPHPNTAKLFANWLFSKEGQEAWWFRPNDTSCSLRADLQHKWRTPKDNPASNCGEKIQTGDLFFSTSRWSNWDLRVLGTNVGLRVYGR